MIARGMSFGVRHQHVVLGDRQGDAGDVGFLERIGTDQRAALLTGDRHDRHGVHVRVGDGGDEVRRTRPRRRHAHPDLAGGLRVPRRGVARALLVAHQHVAHAGRVEQRVVGREDGAAGNAEDHLAAHLLQRADERLRARHRHRVETGCDRSRLAGGGGRAGPARRGRRFRAGTGRCGGHEGVCSAAIWGSAFGSAHEKTPDHRDRRNEGGASTSECSLRRGRACEVRGVGSTTCSDASSPRAGASTPREGGTRSWEMPAEIRPSANLAQLRAPRTPPAVCEEQKGVRGRGRAPALAPDRTRWIGHQPQRPGNTSMPCGEENAGSIRRCSDGSPMPRPTASDRLRPSPLHQGSGMERHQTSWSMQTGTSGRRCQRHLGH